MFKRLVIGISLLAILLTACGNAPPTSGELQDFANVCSKSNDGKRVAVVGYLRFPNSFSGTDSVVLRLYTTSDFSGAPIGVTLDFGTKANQVEPVKDQFSDSDLKVHLSSGEVSGVGTKVKVSGSVYFPLVGQEFACGLDNPLVEAAK